MNERALAGLFLIACSAGLIWAWWTGHLNNLLTGATSRVGGTMPTPSTTPFGGTTPTTGTTPRYGLSPKGGQVL